MVSLLVKAAGLRSLQQACWMQMPMLPLPLLLLLLLPPLLVRLELLLPELIARWPWASWSSIPVEVASPLEQHPRGWLVVEQPERQHRRVQVISAGWTGFRPVAQTSGFPQTQSWAPCSHGLCRFGDSARTWSSGSACTHPKFGAEAC